MSTSYRLEFTFDWETLKGSFQFQDLEGNEPTGEQLTEAAAMLEAVHRILNDPYDSIPGQVRGQIPLRVILKEGHARYMQHDLEDRERHPERYENPSHIEAMGT